MMELEKLPRRLNCELFFDFVVELFCTGISSSDFSSVSSTVSSVFLTVSSDFRTFLGAQSTSSSSSSESKSAESAVLFFCELLLSELEISFLILEHLVLLASSSDWSEFSDAMGRFKFFLSVLGVSLVGDSKVSTPLSDSESDLSLGGAEAPSPKLGRPLGNISSISESESESEYSDSLRGFDEVFGGALTSQTISISESESSTFSTGDLDFSRCSSV